MDRVVELFFAPLDAYQPAGMFTAPHLISLIISLGVLTYVCYRSKQLPWESVIKLTRLIAIIVTVLELLKIGYNFYYGYTCLDAWFPLSFCSLFIYATWFSGYGKGILKKVGDAYIVMGCVIGGFIFLLLPTTSLMRYPIWHFLCIYSLVFHLLMFYLGVLYISHRKIALNKTTYYYFCNYFLIAAIICITLNHFFGSNLMILRDPFNVPLLFVHQIKEKSQVAYTILATLAYLIGPALFALSVNAWRKRKTTNI